VTASTPVVDIIAVTGIIIIIVPAAECAGLIIACGTIIAVAIIATTAIIARADVYAAIAIAVIIGAAPQCQRANQAHRSQ